MGGQEMRCGRHGKSGGERMTMANNGFQVQVTAKDESTAKRYAELAQKMAGDEKFLNAVRFCQSERDLYDVYVKYGYTDLPFGEFSEQLGGALRQIQGVAGDGAELSEEELENVVGGFDFFKFCTTVVSVVPVVGPVVSGVAKAVKAGIEGKGVEAIVLECAKGAGLAMVDGVALLATGGMSAGVQMGVKIGLGAVKAGLNEATA